MEITYDLEFLPEKRSNTQESEEVTAIKIFLAGRQKNMCFRYDSVKQANSRATAIRAFRKRHNLLDIFDFYRRENCVYVVNTKKKG